MTRPNLSTAKASLNRRMKHCLSSAEPTRKSMLKHINKIKRNKKALVRVLNPNPNQSRLASDSS